jgi:hypothetical protein
MVTIITWACLSIQGAVGQGVRVLNTEFAKLIMNSNDYLGWENAVGLLLLMFVLAIVFIPPQQLQQIIQQFLNGLVEGAIMGAVIALAILLVKKRMKEEVEW